MSSPVPEGGPLEYVHAASFSREENSAAAWGVFLGMPWVWLIPFLMLSAAVAVLTGIILFPPLYVLVPLATVMIIYIVHRAVRESRRRNGAIIVGYVDTAVRLNLPVHAFLSAAEASERGRCARQIVELRSLLHAGLPIGAALREIPDVPRETAERIAAGEAMGQLRQSVMKSREFDRQKDQERLENPDAVVYRLYPLFLVFVLSAFLLFTMFFVIPKFEEIFKDFGTPLPEVTQRLINFCGFFTEDTPLGVLLVLGLAGLILLTGSTLMTRIFLPGFPLPPFGRMAQWVAWRIPFARTIQLNKGMAETCELLATSIREGATLPDTLRRAEMLPVNTGFKAQIAAFRQAIGEGKLLHDAAESARLPHLLVGLLAMPSTPGESQAAMFGFLARHYRQRFTRAILFLQSSYMPIVVILLGFIIGFILLGLFSPLSALIMSVINQGQKGVL
jgi:type IV pilus assembly protein PilC